MNTEPHLQSRASLKPHRREILDTLTDSVIGEFSCASPMQNMVSDSVTLKRESVRDNPLMFLHKGYGLF
jgi:hypothetical protein